MHRRVFRRAGFTLIELVMVLAIIGLLATIAHPEMFQKAVTRTKETALKKNLFVMRDAIDQFYTDHGRYPTTLEELVEKEYMRAIPVDPFTRASDWALTFHTEGGVFDVQSSRPSSDSVE